MTELKRMRFSNLQSIKGFDSLKIKRLALYLFKKSYDGYTNVG